MDSDKKVQSRNNNKRSKENFSNDSRSMVRVPNSHIFKICKFCLYSQPVKRRERTIPSLKWVFLNLDTHSHTHTHTHTHTASACAVSLNVSLWLVTVKSAGCLRLCLARCKSNTHKHKCYCRQTHITVDVYTIKQPSLLMEICLMCLGHKCSQTR